MQYTKEPIDKNPERGSPDSTEHASILPIHSISTSALGLTEAQGMPHFIPPHNRTSDDGMNEPIVYSGVDDSARPRGVASDVQVASQVFPYGAPVCLDEGCTITAFFISSQGNRGASIAPPECQGPNMCKQTSSENDTVGPIVRTPIDTTYRMVDGARFLSIDQRARYCVKCSY